MPFYAHPTSLISPGDVFPDIPVSISIPPLRVVRKSKFVPKAKFGPQDLRRIYTLPTDAGEINDLKIGTKHGEETIAATRQGLAMFLSWGSQVEADEREIEKSGDPQRKGWIAAPIYSLASVPPSAVIEDPDTHERISIRDVVKRNGSHNYFYLPPFPDGSDVEGHYVDFRKISSVGTGFFTSRRDHRLVTLTPESLNLLFSKLMWFFTRAEYFFEPIQCSNCGAEVAIDIRFEGQNLDADPWE